MRRVVIYIDGACSRNGLAGANSGIGVKWPHEPKNDISEPLPGERQTNQRAEIEAARRGIEQAKGLGYEKITVKTDSHYVKNAAESWIPKWNKNGWNNANGGPIVNRREFEGLHEAMKDVDVEFDYIPSKNNMADPLAREGANRRSESYPLKKRS